MRDWSIMVKERAGRDPALHAVPSGFSWGALIFRELWALYRGAWYTAGVFLVAIPAATLIAQAFGLDPLGLAIVQFSATLILAIGATELSLAELGLRRYRLLTILKARDLDEAEALGLILWSQGHRPAAVPAAAIGTAPRAQPEAPRDAPVTGDPLWKP